MRNSLCVQIPMTGSSLEAVPFTVDFIKDGTMADETNIPGCPPSINNPKIRAVWAPYMREIIKQGPVTADDLRSHEKLFMEYDRLQTALEKMQHQRRDAKFIMEFSKLQKEGEALMEEIAHRVAPREFPGR